jgi:phosphatidylglycerophosphate synthase
MGAAADHVREHGSLLAAPEKMALVWLAQRLPSWVSSDHLTLLALAAMLFAGLAFWAARWNRWTLYAAIAALGLNWFGDSLDGTLARVRGRQRPRYGYYVDHVLDLLGTLLLVGGLALSGFIAPAIALGFLAAYFMVAAEIYLATHAGGVFRISFGWIGPTELRILLALGAWRLARGSDIDLGALGTARLFDVGGAIAIAAQALAWVVSTARNTRALSRAEPLPR